MVMTAKTFKLQKHFAQIASPINFCWTSSIQNLVCFIDIHDCTITPLSAKATQLLQNDLYQQLRGVTPADSL